MRMVSRTSTWRAEPPMTRCPKCDQLLLPPDLMRKPHTCPAATPPLGSPDHRTTASGPTKETPR